MPDFDLQVLVVLPKVHVACFGARDEHVVVDKSRTKKRCRPIRMLRLAEGHAAQILLIFRLGLGVGKEVLDDQLSEG